jgi:hypothetical protein
VASGPVAGLRRPTTLRSRGANSIGGSVPPTATLRRLGSGRLGPDRELGWRKPRRSRALFRVPGYAAPGPLEAASTDFACLSTRHNPAPLSRLAMAPEKERRHGHSESLSVQRLLARS